MSVLADRIKIMRSYEGPQQNNNVCQSTNKKSDEEMAHDRETSDDIPTPILGKLGPPPGPDFDLSVQHLLNCGGGTKDNGGDDVHLSCHGGSTLRAYHYIHSHLGYIVGASCLNYLACSNESEDGFCPQVRKMTSCDSWNVCRTCDGFSSTTTTKGEKSSSDNDENEEDMTAIVGGSNNDNSGGDDEAERDEFGCRAVPEELIPRVTIGEYGMIEPGNIHAIKAEIYARYELVNFNLLYDGYVCFHLVVLI